MTVPAHHFRSTFSNSLFILLVVLSVARSVSCSQLFTNGLSIIDSPSPDSPAHAGSILAIAVDVSGDGQLSPDSANPNSTLPTHISLLEIYLVSDETNLNITVSSGTVFLTNETGSVRHLHWPVPTCLPAGRYNLTFYETSQVDGTAHFIITPVSLNVQNTNPTGTCTEVNPLQAQPQTSAPLQQSPFLPPGNSPSATLVTITISDGGFQFPTITETVTPTAFTTMVIISMETLTTVVAQQQGTVTSVLTESFTTTAVMPQSDVPGFIPVNGGVARHPSLPMLYWFLSICIFILYR